jgi:hypothetical protein
LNISPNLENFASGVLAFKFVKKKIYWNSVPMRTYLTADDCLHCEHLSSSMELQYFTRKDMTHTWVEPH